MILKVAAVIGLGFQRRVLVAILPVELTSGYFDGQIYNLISHGFIKEVESKRKEDRRYSFTHSSLQEALYNLLLFSHRRRLHRAIAEYYESNSIPVFTLLAHHYLHSLEARVG